MIKALGLNNTYNIINGGAKNNASKSDTYILTRKDEI